MYALKENDYTALLRDELLNSFISFTKYFYKKRTGRDYIISCPVDRQPLEIQIAKKFVKVYKGDIKKLIINIPPRYGKTELAISFIAWSLARNPSSEFIYVSYSKTLAMQQTAAVREIVSCIDYCQLFDVHLSKETNGKAHFETTEGGVVYACGNEGTLTGMGAGVAGIKQFSGCIIIDDIIKPQEAASDAVRPRVNEWYKNTLKSRLNNGNDTPIIFIGQRTHEDDLAQKLLDGYDGDWHSLVLPALSVDGHALLERQHSREDLIEMQESSPYLFATQYQQTPTPAGGAVFKRDWIRLLDIEPSFKFTFITADTAETSNKHNDPTVFCFWGAYSINDVNAVHLIDCIEEWVEPKDLKPLFDDFYMQCNMHKVKPSRVYIEKKSTGSTLLSLLREAIGISVIDIKRNTRMSKSDRFLEMQSAVASKLFSMMKYDGHTEKVLSHIEKITANNTHRHDDIADNFYDAWDVVINRKIAFSREDEEEEDCADWYRSY